MYGRFEFLLSSSYSPYTVPPGLAPYILCRRGCVRVHKHTHKHTHTHAHTQSHTQPFRVIFSGGLSLRSWMLLPPFLSLFSSPSFPLLSPVSLPTLSSRVRGWLWQFICVSYLMIFNDLKMLFCKSWLQMTWSIKSLRLYLCDVIVWSCVAYLFLVLFTIKTWSFHHCF